MSRETNRKYIQVFGTKVKMNEKVKYLGVMLDPKLNSNKHITHTTEKVSEVIGADAIARKEEQNDNKKQMNDVQRNNKTIHTLRCFVLGQNDFRIINKQATKNSKTYTWGWS